MLVDAQAVEVLVSLLEYPRASGEELFAQCERLVPALASDVAAGLRRFGAGVRPLSAAALQELYTQTFDLNASCTMDIGWHVFGERYERGAFLSELRPQLASAGISEAGELPDHLPRVLLLLLRWHDARGAELRDVVRFGVKKLIAALHERDSPYEHLVSSALAAASPGA